MSERLQLDFKTLPDGTVAKLKARAFAADMRLNAYCQALLVAATNERPTVTPPETLAEPPWAPR